MGADLVSDGAASLAALLLQSSIALTVSATAAALWCACAPRSRAWARYVVWLAALVVGLAAPLLVATRRVAFSANGAADAGRGFVLHFGPTAEAVIAVWAVVSVALLGRLARQHIALRRWARGLPPLDDDRDGTVARALGTETRFARPVSIVRGAAGDMPVCWGILRPTIMLPADSTAWPDELRRVVVRHEWAHIQQRDALAGIVGQIIVALLWFHPATWLVARRVRIERERACDERVIGSGIDPLAYGRQLLALACGARRMPAVAAPVAAPVAGRGELEERIAALLVADTYAPGRRRGARCALGAVAAFTFVALSAMMLTPVVRTQGSVSAGRAAPPLPATLPGSHPGSFRTPLFGGGQ